MYEKEMGKLRSLYEQGVFEKSFYADRLGGVDAFESYEQFTKIPFMKKEDIRATKPFDRCFASHGEVYGIFSSSGTTGEKTFYVYSNRDKAVHERFVKLFYEELGVRADDLGGVFAPVDTGVMAHSMMWQFTTMGSGYVNCPEPSPDNMMDFITKLPVSIVATRPSVVSSIIGNPEFEKTAQESDVRMMLLGGGFLTEGRRRALEKAWGADCYCMFGMSEVFGPMGGECRHKCGIHYPDEYLLIEVVDPKTGQPVGPGEYGVAVYTTLWDKGFPILRYWTDDYIAVDTTPCLCGRGLPRFRYKGRMADSIEIGGEYIFPAMLEEVLFRHGFMGEYRAIRGERVRVILEQTGNFRVLPQLKQDIDALFKCEVELEFASGDALMYDGHAIRFITENK